MLHLLFTQEKQFMYTNTTFIPWPFSKNILLEKNCSYLISIMTRIYSCSLYIVPSITQCFKKWKNNATSPECLKQKAKRNFCQKFFCQSLRQSLRFATSPKCTFFGFQSTVHKDYLSISKKAVMGTRRVVKFVNGPFGNP